MNKITILLYLFFLLLCSAAYSQDCIASTASFNVISQTGNDCTTQFTISWVSTPNAGLVSASIDGCALPECANLASASDNSMTLTTVLPCDQQACISISAITLIGDNCHMNQICFDALPVELISFDATLKDEKVLLEWATASEINNKGFEIQYSGNAKTWSSIEFIKGNGSIELQNNYSALVDARIGKNYFRLKQIDFNGDFEYSKIREVTFFRTAFVYPNPIKGDVLRFTLDGEQKEMPVSFLPAGIYHYQLVDKYNKPFTISFSKNK